MLSERERREWAVIEQRLRRDLYLADLLRLVASGPWRRRWRIEVSVTVIVLGWWLLAVVLMWWWTLQVALAVASVLTAVAVLIGGGRRGVSGTNRE